MSADPLSDGAAAERSVTGVALETAELTAGYGGSPVIHGISLSVAPGEVVSIVGPNGSGKSTLLKSIVGVVETLSGRVVIGEADVTGRRSEDIARMGVGYVPQVDDVFAPLTVRENLEMGGYLLKSREVAPRIEHVLTVFPRLAEMMSRRAGKLSGGERKMLAMGRVLMLSPALVVLDEPTANLAPQIARHSAGDARPSARPHRRVGAGRRAAGASRAADLRSHLCHGRRSAADGGNPLRARRQSRVRRSFLGGGSRVA